MTEVTANGHVNQDSARRVEAHRESGNHESGNRESCGHKHYVIANPETPTSRIACGHVKAGHMDHCVASMGLKFGKEKIGEQRILEVP
jgi:hypothetical protein